MAFMGHRKYKYLLLLPIIVLICNVALLQFSLGENDKAMLDEKYISIFRYIEMLGAGVEANPDRAAADQEKNIKDYIESVDQIYQVFAEGYKYNGEVLERFTERFYETSMFEPLDYPEFVEAAMDNECGKIIIGFHPDDQDYRDMHLYYRWMPLYADEHDRYLAVGGVSNFSITAKPSHWVNIANITTIGVNFILQIILIVWLSQIGYVYSNRSGGKWRSKEE